MKKCIAVVVLVAVAAACGCSHEVDTARLIPPKDKYHTKILRDTWGVPHIFGKTDPDVAYGLAYAHCEDDFDTIQQAMFLCRAKIASIEGKDAAPLDYLVNLFRFREIVNDRYDKDLAPETRAICEAYADGYNHFAALHPEKVKPGVLPATGKDVVAGFVIKTPLFFGLDGEVKRLFDQTRLRKTSDKIAATEGNPLTHGLPIGSNTFAISPKRSADGSTFLAINSHQPWTGPVAWYEAHLHSEEGWNMVGGVFPGTPVILHGHNPDLGWAHTVNSPDLVDIYQLDMNPDNANQYKFDGQWKDLEVGQATLDVKIWGPIHWPVKRETLFSVYGPVIRQPWGAYAIRYAGYGDIRQVEQWFKMNKAHDIHQFEDALKMQAIPSFNIGYADKEGNIWYIYNAKFPKRSEKYNWRDYLPGNTSETLWTDYLPFDKVPQVKNPACGFVLNCNSTPFLATDAAENPKEESFSKTLGIETTMTNRSLRLMELLEADKSITEDEFYKYKFDIKYSKDSKAAKFREQFLAAPASDDPVVKEALELVRNWDGDTNLENTGAAISILSMEPLVRAELFGTPMGDPIEGFKQKAHLLKDTYGRVDVPWKQVNHLVRGKLTLPVSGGPDVLHAVYGEWKDGQLVGAAGDCYVLLVSWDKNGKVHSRSIHQFGSATLDETSPHYADQAQMFADCKTKPVWLDEAEIRQHLEGEYAPGEPRPKAAKVSGA